MMSRTLSLFAVLMVFILSACKQDQKKVEPITDAPSPIETLITQWNTSLNKKNLQDLSGLYADQVSLYGTSLSKDDVLLHKKAFFEKHPDFKQTIIGTPNISKISDREYKVDFTKRSSFDGKTFDVGGYLLFNRSGNLWKITNESDHLTDKNVTKSSGKSVTCIDLVTNILTTSTAYMKKTKGLKDAVIDNGGKGFGITLEGSPNPKIDGALVYSDTYDFSLHETYSDRMPVIDRFKFDPSTKQLYEYHVVDDEYTPIAFNKDLLAQFEGLCN